MVFGHNTNLKLGDVTFHVQTEDRGESHALIDTTVYYHGRVLHRRTNNYFDLLPLNDDRQEALRLRLEDQHSTVIEEIRAGALQLTIPPLRDAGPANSRSGAFIPPASDSADSVGAKHAAPHPGTQPPVQRQVASVQPIAEPRALSLELTNAKSWLAGKRVKLQLAVRDHSGVPVPNAQIHVEIEGGENSIPLQAQTSDLGEAQLEFEMPKITSAQAALVISAENHSGKAHLRFALRVKPRLT